MARQRIRSEEWPQAKVGRQPGLDRGVGMPAMVAVLALLLAFAQAAVWFVGWLGCLQLARSVADNAAVAAASALGDGSDACEVARRVAELSRGELETCRIVSTRLGPGVKVSVSVELLPAMPLGQQRVVGESLAGPGR